MEILRITKPERSWYEIILWWELRRIPFNIFMYFAGLTSFYIGYVTLPLLYIIIALLLNIGYTCCWIFEVVVVREYLGAVRTKYPKIVFISYLALSIALVFGFAFFLII